MKNEFEKLKLYIIDNKDYLTKDKLIHILNKFNLDETSKSELLDLINESTYTSFNNPIANYLKEIGQYPVLNHDELVNLFKKMHQGDKKARQLIINSNLRFVVEVAKMYNENINNFLDIVEYGNLGLIKAIDKFDYNLGYKFTTYAFFWIRHHIINSYNDLNVKISDTDRKILLKIKKYEIKLSKLLNKTPSMKEVINYYNELNPNKPLNVFDLEKLKILVKHPISLNQMIKEDDNNKNEMMKLVPDQTQDTSEDAISNIYYDQIRNIIMGNAKSNLTEKEKNVLNLFFGFENESITLDAIAKQYGVTRQRILQIKKETLQKLITNKNTRNLFKK